eukprot:7387499-Prymnesium_polylepis.1
MSNTLRLQFAPGEEQYFVHSDLSILCTLDTCSAAYRRLVTLAICLAFLWPIGAPCLFAALLVSTQRR